MSLFSRAFVHLYKKRSISMPMVFIICYLKDAVPEALLSVTIVFHYFPTYMKLSLMLLRQFARKGIVIHLLCGVYGTELPEKMKGSEG
ncbi:hypothetical protein H0X32_04130 [Patescibacteria group bacterium]|nr:hypothetical protein [Patescibacteria group bacterium]